jgi:sulfite oxidase
MREAIMAKLSSDGGAVHRRDFLRQAGAAAAAWAALDALPAWAAEADAAALIAGKDARLIVYNARTLEIETPLALLREHAITPKKLLFVRNNQELADSRSLAPYPTDDWPIDFRGLVEYPRAMSLADLRRMEQIEVELVLQCSGNGRAHFSRAAPVDGSPWANGAMGNVVFRGVPLSAVVEALELNVQPEAAFLTAEGREGPPSRQKADFEHSLPLADALQRSLLALELNGEPLPAVHGGPVRLVMPGYYGTMHVKWLERLRFDASETYNHHQLRRYRTPLQPLTPGAEFTSDLENSEPNWDMKIKSVIFAPLDGESVKPGPNEVRGVAWNDGRARIVAVEVSTDAGATWRASDLERPASPYAWHPWRTRLDLPAGEAAIMARAIDALGRAQPLDGAIAWNPAGYAWNGVQTVRVKVG